MKRFVALALLASACSPFQPPAPVKQGMNEQQVIEAFNKRPPDRVIERTCGNETAGPFPCKIYVYEGSRRDGYRKLSIVFEKAGGRWLVSQWI
jgi:hypothetical protein